MDCSRLIFYLKGSLYHQFLLFAMLIPSLKFVIPQQSPSPEQFMSTHKLSNQPSSMLFNPIAMSPVIIPQIPFPQPFPSYPSFPTTYNPVLTGLCPVNFSALSTILNKTAFDCFENFASVVADSVCCPQLSSLLHIFQGYYTNGSGHLVLETRVARLCLQDVSSILQSKGANESIYRLCSINSSVLTGGSCPVKDVATFERLVNVNKLLAAFEPVDSLRECCKPVCRSAITEAAFIISRKHSAVPDQKNKMMIHDNVTIRKDCSGVVYSWLSRKLPLETANTAFRLLSSCNVNRVCPLRFKEPTEVVDACSKDSTGNPSCCDHLNGYIAGIEKKVFITHQQAIVCATEFGSKLLNRNVTANLYESCHVDLKDFSIQALGQQAEAGCLLRSQPADMVFDSASGLTFMCDLSADIAPWPSSSSFPFCAREMSLPALPTAETLGNRGGDRLGIGLRGWLASILLIKIAICM